MLSSFWRHLLKTGVVLLLAYLLLAYSLLLTIIIRKELQILDARRVIPAFSAGQVDLGTLQGQVRNVFGDPVPYAVILMENRLVQADNTGRFLLENLKPGRHLLEIFAGEYERYERDIVIESGLNSPPIKYDTGLWPQVFLVDFHIYYKNPQQILGIVGFANGSPKPIFIQRATLLNPQGQVITDLLHDHDGFNYYTNLSSKLEIKTGPQKALLWAPRMWQSGEIPPLYGSFPPGLYSLEVHYAFLEGHELGQYQVLTITDHLDAESDWNPHLP